MVSPWYRALRFPHALQHLPQGWERAPRLARDPPQANIAHNAQSERRAFRTGREDRGMRIIGIAAALLLCGAVALPATGASAQALKKISDGQVSKTAPNWPSFIAAEKGFFRREGVELETTYVGNVANTVQQLVAGSFDVASSTFDTAIRAIANGGSAVMIGGVVTKYPYSIMSVASVTNAAGMKGKRVILPFPKDLLTIVWNRWLTEQGMKPDEVEQVYAGATPNRLAALVSGTVQASLLTQPFDFRAAADGYKKLLDIGAYGKQYGFLTVLARPQWLRDNPDTARAYLRAVTAAVDWLYDPANRNEAIAILAKSVQLDPKIAEQTYDYYVKELQPFSRKLAIPSEIVPTTVKTLIELGDIKPDSAGKTYADLTYLPR
jgi:ABC-type nitrate/sulfonate/bicarbonate transport system substrate-binding protein